MPDTENKKMKKAILCIFKLDRLQAQLSEMGYFKNGCWDTDRLMEECEKQNGDTNIKKFVAWCPLGSVDDDACDTINMPMKYSIKEYGEYIPTIMSYKDMVHGNIYTTELHLLLDYTMKDESLQEHCWGWDDGMKGQTTKIVIPITFRYEEVANA